MVPDKIQALPRETTYDRIFAWYNEGDEYVKLTEKELEIQKRWEQCWLMLCNGRSPERVVRFMTRIHEISRSQAYLDVKHAVKLFGEVTKTSNEGKRHIYEQYAIKIYNVALRKSPPDLKAANAALANMINLSGIDKDDPNIPDFSKLQQHIYNIGIDPQLVHQLLTFFVKKGAINLADFRNEEIRTIDVTPTDEQPGSKADNT